MTLRFSAPFRPWRRNTPYSPPTIVPQDGADLCTLQLFVAAGKDALDALALVEGYIALWHSSGDGAILLRHSIRLGATVLAESLATQAASAPSSMGPLERQVVGKGLELALLLGLSRRQLFKLITDQGRPPGSRTSRGILFVERFKATLLPHFAREPQEFGVALLKEVAAVSLPHPLAPPIPSHPELHAPSDGQRSMLPSQGEGCGSTDRRALFRLLLDLLDHHIMDASLPAEELVTALNDALPNLLTELSWPNPEWLDPMLSLFQKLLRLGDYIVLRDPRGGDGPSDLLNAWKALLPAGGGVPPGARSCVCSLAGRSQPPSQNQADTAQRSSLPK